MKEIFPILTCEDAWRVESEILTDEAKNYAAIEAVGAGVARRFLAECAPQLPEEPNILVLAGKGHNGADALSAARRICAKFPGAKLAVALPDAAEMKKLTLKALEELRNSAASMREIPLGDIRRQCASNGKAFDLLIEGLTGMNFSPPAKDFLKECIDAANSVDAAIKIAMDMPAGISDWRRPDIAFKADITYSNGIAKAAIFRDFNREYVGRIRHVDIGFFNFESALEAARGASEYVAGAKVLKPLLKLRKALTDKRDYGHLLVVAGSERYPGAALLNVSAALRTGVGIVTALVPKSLAPSFAAAQPSAIWLGGETDKDGTMRPENVSKIAEMKPPTAILAGSGLGSSAGARKLVAETLKLHADVARVLDADAICPELAGIGRAADLALTPHAGEFLRIAPQTSDSELRAACKKYGASIALKGPVTSVCGEKSGIVRCVEGGPALSRGGSGDVLAGICAGLMARQDLGQTTEQKLAMASVWMSMASELLFAKFSENCAPSSCLPDMMPDALKNI